MRTFQNVYNQLNINTIYPSDTSQLSTNNEEENLKYNFKPKIATLTNLLNIWKMNNYIVRSYRYVIVITKFAITKFAIRRASKAQSIVMY